jgi:hypothetical protein
LSCRAIRAKSSSDGFSRPGRNSSIVESLRTIGVFTVVGWIVLTRMFSGPSSSASTFIRPTTPCLAAA